MQPRLKQTAGMLMLCVLAQFLFVPSAFAYDNLVSNPSAETGDFTAWTVVNGGDGWAMSDDAHSGDHSYVGSYEYGTLTQVLDLVALGYSTDSLDRQPSIDFSTYVKGVNYGSSTEDYYWVTVILLDGSDIEITRFDTEESRTTSEWQEISNTFSDYGTGLRSISIELQGKDANWWLGNYGPVFDDTSLVIQGNLTVGGSIPFPTTASNGNIKDSETQAQPLPFIDIAETEHQTAIEFLYESEIVKGYKNEEGEKEFKPDQNINRAEFLKMVMSLTEKSVEDEKSCFTDVKEQWFAPYVCTAYKEGIITGYGDGSFMPERAITFEEMFAIVLRAYAEEPESNSVEAWYKGYWDKVTDLNLLDKLTPVVSQNITRGEAAQFLFNMASSL